MISCSTRLYPSFLVFFYLVHLRLLVAVDRPLLTNVKSSWNPKMVATENYKIRSVQQKRKCSYPNSSRFTIINFHHFAQLIGYFSSISGNFPWYRHRGAGMAQWWEHSPPTNVSQVRFPDSWICCLFSSLLRGFFSGYSSFPPSTKTNISKFQFDLETVERRTTPWIPLKFLLFCLL